MRPALLMRPRGWPACARPPLAPATALFPVARAMPSSPVFLSTAFATPAALAALGDPGLSEALCLTIVRDVQGMARRSSVVAALSSAAQVKQFGGKAVQCI